MSPEKLRRYHELRETRRQEEARIRATKAEEDGLETEIVEWLQGLGRKTYTLQGYTALLKDGQRRPAWQEIVREYLGADKVAEIIAETKPGIVLIVEPSRA